MTYKTTFSIKQLWFILAVSLILSFSVLLFFGGVIYQKAPPIPERVQTNSGVLLFEKENIQTGQRVWQSIGGMELGSIWGHGSYLAPDWSADWLHREAMAMLEQASQVRFGRPYKDIADQQQAYLQIDLQTELRENRLDENNGVLTISTERAQAIKQLTEHYRNIFSLPTKPEYRDYREKTAIVANMDLNVDQVDDMAAFFFWTSWAAVTNRPGDSISYTNNWPHEKLVANEPTAPLFLWTLFSIIFLLAGIAALCWYYVRQYDVWREDLLPDQGVAQTDVFADVQLTPSMKATLKYFAVVVILILLQITLGAVTAHYAVEGHEFYGIPLADIFPYTVTRTWHIQSALFWIATSWLAAGLFLMPLISGYEPRYQTFGVNFLFVCLLIIVVGSFAGQWLAVQQKLGNGSLNFWFGHQGYEYVDLGRFWQAFLFVGLLVWLVLMLRALLPALRQGQERFHLLLLLTLSAAAIAGLYGAGLAWGENSHLSIVEYWRWWVVHLWVEGVFEVFATAIIAILFVRMGLLRSTTATISVLFATFIFLSGGVLGTFHHLYFSGTPIGVLALGGVFSALEVVPLVIIGFEAYSHYKVERLASNWINRYHWPLMFLMAVSFWNLVGAGLLGFLINPPLALYYMQGLNTTPLHGHAALFGVYGLLGIGLTLFCLCIATDKKYWNSPWLKTTFWSFNIGLAVMLFLSLLPQGVLQVIESYSVGYWSARSPEFIHQPVMEWLVWARVPGDLIFTLGAIGLVVFTAKLYRR